MQIIAYKTIYNVKYYTNKKGVDSGDTIKDNQ